MESNISLFNKLLDTANIINQRSTHGGANYITASSNIANILSNRFRNSSRKEKIYSIYGIE